MAVLSFAIESFPFCLLTASHIKATYCLGHIIWVAPEIILTSSNRVSDTVSKENSSKSRASEAVSKQNGNDSIAKDKTAIHRQEQFYSLIKQLAKLLKQPDIIDAMLSRDGHNPVILMLRQAILMLAIWFPSYFSIEQIHESISESHGCHINRESHHECPTKGTNGCPVNVNHCPVQHSSSSDSSTFDSYLWPCHLPRLFEPMKGKYKPFNKSNAIQPNDDDKTISECSPQEIDQQQCCPQTPQTRSDEQKLCPAIQNAIDLRNLLLENLRFTREEVLQVFQAAFQAFGHDDIEEEESFHCKAMIFERILNEILY